MKTITIFSLTLLILASCSDNKNNQAKPATQRAKTQAESFDTFFERFSSDSVFQKSRVNFPLNMEVYDVGADSTTTPVIKANEWSFFNIKALGKKYIFKTRKDNNRYILTAQIEDTGVYVEYIFDLRESKWTLVKIIDEST